MDDSQSAEIQCPYCGEEIEVIVDCSVGRQVYTVDCTARRIGARSADQ